MTSATPSGSRTISARPGCWTSGTLTRSGRAHRSRFFSITSISAATKERSVRRASRGGFPMSSCIASMSSSSPSASSRLKAWSSSRLQSRGRVSPLSNDLRSSWTSSRTDDASGTSGPPPPSGTAPATSSTSLVIASTSCRVSATHEAVHRHVHAEKVHQTVEDRRRKCAENREQSHDRGQHEHPAVPGDRVGDPDGDVPGAKDWQEERDAGPDTTEHPGVDVIGAHHRGHHLWRAAVELDAQGLVEADRGVLRRRVVGLASHAHETGRRRHGHDVTVTGFHHRREERLGHPEQREHVDVEGAPDHVVGDVQKTLPAHDAGVVDEDLDVADLLAHLVRGPVDRGRVANVARVAVGLATTQPLELGDGRPELLLVSVPDDGDGAPAGHLEGQRAADARCAAGHEDDPVPHVGHRASLPAAPFARHGVPGQGVELSRTFCSSERRDRETRGPNSGGAAPTAPYDSSRRRSWTVSRRTATLALPSRTKTTAGRGTLL